MDEKKPRQAGLVNQAFIIACELCSRSTLLLLAECAFDAALEPSHAVKESLLIFIFHFDLKTDDTIEFIVGITQRELDRLSLDNRHYRIAGLAKIRDTERETGILSFDRLFWL